MRSGDFRRRITILQPSSSRDAAGQPLATSGDWTELCTTWADFMAPSGMGSIAAETENGGRQVGTMVCSWRIRWRTGITAAMRVQETLGGVTNLWDIKQVLPDLKFRRHVDLVCEAGGVQ